MKKHRINFVIPGDCMMGTAISEFGCRITELEFWHPQEGTFSVPVKTEVVCRDDTVFVAAFADILLEGDVQMRAMQVSVTSKAAEALSKYMDECIVRPFFPTIVPLNKFVVMYDVNTAMPIKCIPCAQEGAVDVRWALDGKWASPKDDAVVRLLNSPVFAVCSALQHMRQVGPRVVADKMAWVLSDPFLDKRRVAKALVHTATGKAPVMARTFFKDLTPKNGDVSPAPRAFVAAENFRSDYPDMYDPYSFVDITEYEARALAHIMRTEYEFYLQDFSDVCEYILELSIRWTMAE